MTHLESGRAAFEILRNKILSEADLKDDIERAFDLLLSRYNTKIYENRFLVGGVAERIIAAAFLAIGHAADKTGVTVTRTDIKVAGSDLSVKGSFKPGSGDIRLINTMGDSSDPVWDEPTIFIFSESGIGYADPEILPNMTRRVRDALIIKSRDISAFWESNPGFHIPLTIPYSRTDVDGSDVASRAVADEIFRYNMKRLRPFDTRTPQD